MMPSSRSRMTASRSASRTAVRISRWSSSSCSDSSSGPSAFGQTWLASCSNLLAQLVDQLAVAGVLDLEVVEPPERRLDRRQARLGLLGVGAGRRDDPSRRTSHGRRQPLADERGEDDAEGQEDDEVALGEVERERERRRQRDRAAHPRPGDDHDGLRRRRRVARPDPLAQHPGQVGRREDPHEAGDDDGQADGQP